MRGANLFMASIYVKCTGVRIEGKCAGKQSARRVKGGLAVVKVNCAVLIGPQTRNGGYT